MASRRLVLLAAVVAAAACGSQDARAPSTGSADRAAPSTLTRGTEVSFTTGDQVEIGGTLRVPPDAGQSPVTAVVLVHQLGGDRFDFNALIPALQDAGNATLTYDIRGMGRSNSMVDGTVYRPGTDRAAYYATMPRDVSAALRYLRGRRDVDGERLAVLGSSLGANIALLASGLPDGPETTVALSPVAGDILPPRAARGRRARNVLMIATGSRSARPGRSPAESSGPSASRSRSSRGTASCSPRTSTCSRRSSIGSSAGSAAPDRDARRHPCPRGRARGVRRPNRRRAPRGLISTTASPPTKGSPR